MIIKLGFTGSQDGMTILQEERLTELLDGYSTLGQVIFHSGDCIGADEEAHELAKKRGFFTEGHPPIKNHKRAYCEYDLEHEPKDYLDRNRDIVDSCDVLLATPKQYFNVDRSGTWYTIRYAEKKGIKTIVIYPDGTIK